MLRWISGFAAVAAHLAGPVAADELWLTPDLPVARLMLDGREVVISRMRGEAGQVCPPHCLQPIRAGQGVVTFGALEVIGFLANEVNSRKGLVLDVRLPAEFAARRLPGAVNVPLATLSADNPYRRDILLALGVREAAGALDFTDAPRLVVYGEGPMDDAAATAVRFLAEAGYPAEMVKYFRGGLTEWQLFGLTLGGIADQG